MYAVTRAKTWLEIWPGGSGGGLFNEENNREFFLRPRYLLSYATGAHPSVELGDLFMFKTYPY
jgi:hypothetical protein